MKIFTKSDRYMLEQPKIIIISKFYQTHAKISKPTGATAPVEKVKEISSVVIFVVFLVTFPSLATSKMSQNAPSMAKIAVPESRKPHKVQACKSINSGKS